MNTCKHDLTAEENFCLQGCRSYKQYYNMRQGFEANACAFCDIDRSLNEIHWEDGHVVMWEVPEKYLRSSLEVHILIVPKRHIRFEADMKRQEVLSIHEAKVKARNELGYQGGLSHVREGPMNLNAGTVPHLHYNIFQPNGIGEVRIPVSKNSSDRFENEVRATKFAERYNSGEIPK